MDERTKVTIHIPSDLLAKAKKSTGKGITATVIQGLQLLSAKDAYRRIRELRGKVQINIDTEKLREDR